jgi:hypothetical protein
MFILDIFCPEQGTELVRGFKSIVDEYFTFIKPVSSIVAHGHVQYDSVKIPELIDQVLPLLYIILRRRKFAQAIITKRILTQHP